MKDALLIELAGIWELQAETGGDGLSKLQPPARETLRACADTLRSLVESAVQMPVDRATLFVPGKVHCARCKFSLIRTNLYVNSGTTGAGHNKTEPCPNGCGPLWPVTWEQECRETWAALESMFERAKTAEDAIASMRAAGLSLVVPKDGA